MYGKILVPVDGSETSTCGLSEAIQIVAQAKEWPADLIVMGTHGRRGLARLAMGSDAEQVVRAISVPVLVVRSAPPRRKPASQDTSIGVCV
jgi:nucleotide-binding universal stress UspA family protein